ncbi:MAG: hypothetical protein JRE43_04910 [Deltaproteobacteria bacterium]|jgi:hypothetical protein|nr:hypothetical protein [Deltaproteobacteria bacterium]MBW2541591.1 hypothetical protein [Deltaproteobacteria bacterium]
MMDFEKTGPKCRQPRTGTFPLYLGIIALICILLLPNSITSVETDVVRHCASWTERAFKSPSNARDEAFIGCIAKRTPSATPGELRHKLRTGTGDDLFERFMGGEDLPAPVDSTCRYVRVAIQSPVGSEETEQEPMRDLFSQALAREGFNVVDPSEVHHWWASSLALNTSEDFAAWTLLVRATPEIGAGEIHFTTVEKTVNGLEGSFSGMQLLRLFAKHEAPEVARLAAQEVAKNLLPAAHRRCGDANLAFEETWGHLEKLRNELAQEIERVKRENHDRERARAVKRLEIEVEAEG